MQNRADYLHNKVIHNFDLANFYIHMQYVSFSISIFDQTIDF